MKRAVGRPPRSEDEISEFRETVASRALEIYKAEGFDAVSMRRLAKDVGCSATTLYAHFESKTGILMHLWGHILEEMSEEILAELEQVSEPVARLKTAIESFIGYWVDHPDHFRLVFMSNDVGRLDVDSFLDMTKTQAHFALFRNLVAASLGKGENVGAKTDVLVANMIGAALCYNTIKNYPWPSPSVMISHYIDGVIP